MNQFSSTLTRFFLSVIDSLKMMEISVFFAFLWIFGVSFYYSRCSSARTDVGRGQVIMRDRPQTARPEQMRRKRNFDKILKRCESKNL